MPLNTVDLFTRRTLMGVIEKQIKTPVYLRDRFFKRGQDFDTEAVDVDIVDSRDRVLAKFGVEEGNGHLSYDRGFVTESYRPAYIDERFVVNSRDLRKRAPGEYIYEDGGMELDKANARMANIVRRGLERIDKRISRLEEAMCAEAILTGKILVRSNQVNAEFDFWKNLSEDEKPVTTLTTPWTDSSSNPLDDLSIIADKMGDAIGVRPKELYVGTAVWRALRNYFTGRGKDVLDITRVDLGRINPQAADVNDVSYKGHLSDPDLDIYTYTGTYEKDGEIKHYIPEDSVLMVGAGAEDYTYRAYGACEVADEDNKTGRLMAGNRVVDTWYQRDGKKGQVVQIQSAPVMIVSEPRMFHVIRGAVNAS